MRPLITSRVTGRVSNIRSQERHHGSRFSCDKWMKRKTARCYYSENSVFNHRCRREMGYTGRNTCYRDISNPPPWAGWLSDTAVSSGERALPHRQSTSVFTLRWILNKICETQRKERRLPGHSAGQITASVSFRAGSSLPDPIRRHPHFRDEESAGRRGSEMCGKSGKWLSWD